MGQTDRQTYDSVDLAKLIGSFLVIAIHTGIFISFSEVLNFCFVNLFCRIAVYFYFIASSYFFFSAIEFHNDKIKKTKDNIKKLKRYVLRVSLLYVVWSAIYLVLDIIKWYRLGCLSLANFKGYVLSFFTNSSHYHLWFIISLIYAIPIMYFVLRYLGKRVLLVGSLVLYLIGLVYGSYNFIHPPFQSLYTTFADVWPRMSTVLFNVIPICALIFVCDSIKMKRLPLWIVSIIMLILFSFEGMLLYYYFPKNASSYIIFTLPTVLFLFVSIKNTPLTIKRSYEIRKLSTIIYCMHPLVIESLGCCINTKDLNSLVYFLIISLITLLISTILLLLFKKFRFAKPLNYIM